MIPKHTKRKRVKFAKFVTRLTWNCQTNNNSPSKTRTHLLFAVSLIHCFVSFSRFGLLSLSSSLFLFEEEKWGQSFRRLSFWISSSVRSVLHLGLGFNFFICLGVWWSRVGLGVLKIVNRWQKEGVKKGIDGTRFRAKCKGIMRIRLHGWRAGEGEDRQRKRHMWTVPPRGSPILDALAHGAASPPLSSSPNSTTFFSQVFTLLGFWDFLGLRSFLCKCLKFF